MKPAPSRTSNHVTHRQKRRGLGLTELLVTMTIFSVVLALAIALLELLLRLHETGQAHTESQMTTSRLARMFRADVRSALAVEPAPEGAESAADRIVLKLSGEKSVEYAMEAGKLRRVEREGSSTPEVESFRLPRRSGRILLSRNGTRTWLAFEFDPRVGLKKRSTTRPLRIEALVGADHRFEGSN